MSLKLKLSPNLTATAKNVFGEIVVNAWVAVDNFGSGWSDYLQSELEKDEQTFDKVEDELHYDGIIVVLEFTNGRMVRFSNSEWAWMELYRPELDVDKPLPIPPQ